MGPEEASNQSFQHGVSFDEALTVLADPAARIFDDEDHSADEKGEIMIGAFHQATPVGGLLLGAGGHSADLQRPQGHEAGATRL